MENEHPCDICGNVRHLNRCWATEPIKWICDDCIYPNQTPAELDRPENSHKEGGNPGG